MTRILKTEKRVKREAKYIVMYNEYCALIANPENDKTAIIQHLVQKHKISQSCIYNYLRKHPVTIQ